MKNNIIISAISFNSNENFEGLFDNIDLCGMIYRGELKTNEINATIYSIFIEAITKQSLERLIIYNERINEMGLIMRTFVFNNFDHKKYKKLHITRNEADNLTKWFEIVGDNGLDIISKF